MGINWTTEILTWYTRDIFDSVLLKYFLFFSNIILSLQGVLIFVIFICKKKMIRLIAKRFHCLQNTCLSNNSTESTSSTVNSHSLHTTVIPLQE